MSFIKTVFSPTGKQWMFFYGLLLALSFPGFGCWLLAWVMLSPALLWVDRQFQGKSIFWGGFWFGFAFQGLVCLWFFDLHPLTWLGFTEWGSRLTTLGGWLLIAVEGGLLCGLLMLIYKVLKPFWLRLIGFPLAWVLVFYGLHLTPMALPWGLLEYTQAGLPWMRQLAGWMMASGVSAMLVVHNVGWAALFPKLKTRLWLLPLSVVLPVLIFCGGRLNPPAAPVLPMPVATMQANLPIEVIRSERLTLQDIDTAYLQPLRQSTLKPGTLVAFPEEGVVQGLVSYQQPLENAYLRQLQVIASQKRIFIAVGIVFLDDANLHNSIALLSPGDLPVQFYHKRLLVPFGEFTPYGFGEPLKALLEQWSVHYSAPFKEGTEGNFLDVGNIPVGGLVCFELINSDPLQGGYAGAYRRQGAKLLLNISNLGWFHQNPLMEAQFLAIGQMRAAENHLPLVIASNTGISAVIDANGQVLRQTVPNGQGHSGTQVLTYSP